MTAKKKVYQDNYLNIVFYLTLPLLLLPPLYRGLFFDYEFSVARIYAALVLAAYAFIRGDRIRLSRNIMDYAWIGLIVAYIISNFVALNQRSALEGALRIFTFALIYWLLVNTIQGLKDFKNAFTMLFASGVGVALAGLGTAFGTFWFNGAFSENMILSTLQYHNAAAIYLAAASIVGLFLTTQYEHYWSRVAAGSLNYVVLLTAYGAGSRGAMLVAPIGFVLLIAGMPRQYRLRVFLNFVSVLIPFVITAKQVLNFGAHSAGYYWGWLLLGAVLGGGVQYVMERFLGASVETRRRALAGVGIAVAVLGIGMIVFLGAKVMPDTIAARLSNVHFQDGSVQERFYFYRDAFELVKDYPVFGVGGGGWNSVYTGYQSFLYFTTEVHSHPLQVWVETGTVGFIFYVLLWVGLIITTFKIMFRVTSPAYRAVAWTAAVTAVTISLHSTIDFSLSLGAVAIFMYALMGIVGAVEKNGLPEHQSMTAGIGGPGMRKVIGTVLAGVLLLVSGSLYLSAVTEKEAAQAFSAGNVQDSITKFEKALKYDPLNANLHMNLSQIYAQTAYQRGDMALATTALGHAEKAASLNKDSIQQGWALAEIYFMNRRPADAIAKAEQVRSWGPWKQDVYEQLALFYVTTAKAYLQVGDKAAAKVVLNKALNIPNLIQDQLSKLGPVEQRLWTHAPMLTVTDKIKQQLEEAKQLQKSL